MPAHENSLRITDTYRIRLKALRERAVGVARERWALIDSADLDRSHAAWVASVAATVAELQRMGARLSAAYLTAYLGSETKRPLVAAPVDTAAFVGRSRSGKPLAEALVPSLFTVKGAIGEGRELPEALKRGLDRAVRVVGEETRAPARAALSAGMQADERVVGWRRVTSGGCGACLALADGAIHADDDFLEVHDHCECESEPVVRDVPDAVKRPTGHEVFMGLPRDDQDHLLGPEKAALIRAGDVPFHDLIQRDPMDAMQDGITEAPLKALT